MIKTPTESNAQFVQERQMIAKERAQLEKERRDYEKQRKDDNDSLLAKWRDGEIDFMSEAAWAERVFATDNGEEYYEVGAQVKSDEGETVLRSEYARFMRFLAVGGSITNINDRKEIFLGAICVGRPRVAAWAMSGDVNINAVSRFDEKKRSALMWALQGDDEETIRFVWTLRPRVSAVDYCSNA